MSVSVSGLDCSHTILEIRGLNVRKSKGGYALVDWDLRNPVFN